MTRDKCDIKKLYKKETKLLNTSFLYHHSTYTQLRFSNDFKVENRMNSDK